LFYLVQRLRKRFPASLIIVTDTWHLSYILVKENDKIYFFPSWMKENGFKQITSEFLDFMKNSSVEIIFSKQLDMREEFMNHLAQVFDVKIYRWERHVNDFKKLLLQNLVLFHRDGIHLSKEGHAFFARDLRKLIQNQTLPSINLGSWGDGDLCLLWVDNGIVTFKPPSNTMIEKFDKKKNKFALRLPSNGTIMSIYNPFDSPRVLSFWFMATGPNTTIYPKTEISLFNQEPIHILPLENSYNYPVHVQLNKIIGTLHPGNNSVYIKPQEISEAPFRLFGYAITNGKKFPSKMFERPMKLS